ncbi:hypothetical protein COP2_007431 [Malus domestica]
MLIGRIRKWILALSKFNFSTSKGNKGTKVGIVIIDPKRIQHCYSFFLDYMNTSNNKAKYEALFIALEILIELGATEVEIYGDSELVINQLNGEYKYKHLTMAGNYLAATQLLNY